MFIDIHNHCLLYPGVPVYGDEGVMIVPELLRKMDEYNIDKTVILPVVNWESNRSVQGNEEVLEMCRRNPDRFIPFCNIDPRCLNSWRAPLKGILQHYKNAGCKGLGEICANMSFLDPMVLNLFAAAEEVGLPVLFHMTIGLGISYGLVDDNGLPQLEEVLKRFPKLKFFGHSQAFWAEMCENAGFDDRFGYPKHAVSKPGRVVELMRRYPNLYGDLSAGSGLNALKRDRKNAIAFLNEFQDRLFFGTDLCFVSNKTVLCPFLLDLRDSGDISDEVFRKVARENAIRVLEL